jgi:hypothetical protein
MLRGVSYVPAVTWRRFLEGFKFDCKSLALQSGSNESPEDPGFII